MAPAVKKPAPVQANLTNDQLCDKQGGIMAGMVCWRLGNAKKEIEKLQADLVAIEKRADSKGQGHGKKLQEELKRINERLTALEAALKKPSAAGAPQRNDLTPEELKLSIDALRGILDAQTEVTKALSNRDTHQDQVDAEHAEAIEDLKDRVSSVFGLAVNVAANVHALAPYDHVIWGVMPELFWLPEVVDGLRLELGGGYGYAGKLDDENLRVGTVMIGVLPKIYDGFDLGLGVIGEWRTDPSEHTKYASYGGYVEPKYCPGGDTSADSSEYPMQTPPHYFCFGGRMALEATIFQHPIPPLAELPLHPDAGETYTRLDGSFSLFVGYAFLP